MRKYIVKRLILSVIILIFVALIIYTIMRCIPTSYVEKIARERSTKAGSKSYTEWLAQLNSLYGLDTGIIQGFFRWAWSALQGNFGDSWFYTVPVTEKFAEAIWYSFALGAVAFLLEIIIAIPTGHTICTKTIQ